MPLKPPNAGINSGKPKPPELKLPATNEFFAPKNQDTQVNYNNWKQTPDREQQTAMMRSLDPAIRNAVKKYTGGDDAVAMGQAKILVLKALPRFDPKQAKIETFVDRQLQPLMRWQSRRSRPVKMPDQALLDLQRLSNAERELEIENGRAPDIVALADHTGLSRKRIQQLRSGNMMTVNSSQETPDSDGGVSYADEFAVQGGNQDAWIRMVREDLTGPDRFILEHTLGLDGAPRLNNTEIARRLKLSPGAISQRKARIQSLLDRESELSPFYG